MGCTKLQMAVHSIVCIDVKLRSTDLKFVVALDEQEDLSSEDQEYYIH